jgi:hypothetical protein
MKTFEDILVKEGDNYPYKELLENIINLLKNDEV